MPIPLAVAFQGGFCIELAVVEETDTMVQVAEKVAAVTVGRELPACGAPMRVRYKGELQPADVTVAEVGITPMDFLEVLYDA